MCVLTCTVKHLRAWDRASNWIMMRGMAKLSLNGGVHITLVDSVWLNKNISTVIHPPHILPLQGTSECEGVRVVTVCVPDVNSQQEEGGR